ncbi:MAG: hypothetical protein KC463_06405, partial [Streptococcus sp.]|nr:hypothetical protein [Streptococcus sp.]
WRLKIGERSLFRSDANRTLFLLYFKEQAVKLHWSLTVIKSSQQRLILIFEEYKQKMITQQNFFLRADTSERKLHSKKDRSSGPSLISSQFFTCQ